MEGVPRRSIRPATNTKSLVPHFPHSTCRQDNSLFPVTVVIKERDLKPTLSDSFFSLSQIFRCPHFWLRCAAVVIVCLAFFGAGQELIAQNLGTDTPEVASEIPDDESGNTPTILKMLFGGNALGLVIVGLILLLSIVSVYFIIEHFLTISRRRLMPDDVLDELERLIIHGEINKAIEVCSQGKNYSLATEVILAGLHRYKSSEFGFAEYRSAVEEAGEDQTGKLYRRTEVLNVIGAIAPMLGLTGTVLGMIEAFTTIASLEGMARPQELAGGIGQALITTLLGLVVAIPTMVAFSYFRNKIDSLVAEAGKRIERVMMPLGRKKK